jgi:Ca-activated chloride channel family protein
MSKKISRSLLWICLGICLCAARTVNTQEPVNSQIRVVVELVQLNVAVTDSHGDYVTGLRPSDFTVMEDGIPQKISTFAEGNQPTRRLPDGPPVKDDVNRAANGGQPTDQEQDGSSARLSAAELNSITNGAHVFVLFDTSNYMYRGFVFAQDAISDFIRSLENADRIAFYSYSRNLSRAARLTSDRSVVLRGVRTTVAGDDAALYNCLLLTVKDAAQVSGRKVIVVFSNGPDNASIIPPEDVAELAQSTGTVIYMISTQQAQLEPISTAVFERMTAATGGKAYFARNWKDEKRAFASIRDDLAHLYSLSYYPQQNPNRGWRSITVKLNSERLKKCRVRTRNGYRLQPSRFAKAEVTAESDPR